MKNFIGKKAKISLKHSKWLIDHLNVYSYAGSFDKIREQDLAEIAATCEALLTKKSVVGKIVAKNDFMAKDEQAWKIVSKYRGVTFWSWYEKSSFKVIK